MAIRPPASRTLARGGGTEALIGAGNPGRGYVRLARDGGAVMMPHMRRALRWTINGLTVLSLVLCVGTVALWVRSYWVQDAFSTVRGGMQSGGRYHRVMYRGCSVQGINVLQIDVHDDSPPFGDLSYREDVRMALRSITWSHVSPHHFSFNYNPDWRGMPLPYRLGFRFSHRINDDSPSIGYTEARVPDWFLALLTSILPLAFAVTYRRRTRALRLAAVQCVKCGYDLRATPDRCPECGAVPGGKA